MEWKDGTFLTRKSSRKNNPIVPTSDLHPEKLYHKRQEVPSMLPWQPGTVKNARALGTVTKTTTTMCDQNNHVPQYVRLVTQSNPTMQEKKGRHYNIGVHVPTERTIRPVTPQNCTLGVFPINAPLSTKSKKWPCNGVGQSERLAAERQAIDECRLLKQATQVMSHREKQPYYLHGSSVPMGTRKHVQQVHTEVKALSRALEVRRKSAVVDSRRTSYGGEVYVDSHDKSSHTTKDGELNFMDTTFLTEALLDCWILDTNAQMPKCHYIDFAAIKKFNKRDSPVEDESVVGNLNYRNKSPVSIDDTNPQISILFSNSVDELVDTNAEIDMPMDSSHDVKIGTSLSDITDESVEDNQERPRTGSPSRSLSGTPSLTYFDKTIHKRVRQSYGRVSMAFIDLDPQNIPTKPNTLYFKKAEFDQEYDDENFGKVDWDTGENVKQEMNGSQGTLASNEGKELLDEENVSGPGIPTGNVSPGRIDRKQRDTNECQTEPTKDTDGENKDSVEVFVESKETAEFVTEDNDVTQGPTVVVENKEDKPQGAIVLAECNQDEPQGAVVLVERNEDEPQGGVVVAETNQGKPQGAVVVVEKTRIPDVLGQYSSLSKEFLLGQYPSHEFRKGPWRSHHSLELSSSGKSIVSDVGIRDGPSLAKSRSICGAVSTLCSIIEDSEISAESPEHSKSPPQKYPSSDTQLSPTKSSLCEPPFKKSMSISNIHSQDNYDSQCYKTTSDGNVAYLEAIDQTDEATDQLPGLPPRFTQVCNPGVVDIDGGEPNKEFVNDGFMAEDDPEILILRNLAMGYSLKHARSSNMSTNVMECILEEPDSTNVKQLYIPSETRNKRHSIARMENVSRMENIPQNFYRDPNGCLRHLTETGFRSSSDIAENDLLGVSFGGVTYKSVTEDSSGKDEFGGQLDTLLNKLASTSGIAELANSYIHEPFISPQSTSGSLSYISSEEEVEKKNVVCSAPATPGSKPIRELAMGNLLRNLQYKRNSCPHDIMSQWSTDYRMMINKLICASPKGSLPQSLENMLSIEHSKEEVIENIRSRTHSISEHRDDHRNSEILIENTMQQSSCSMKDRMDGLATPEYRVQYKVQSMSAMHDIKTDIAPKKHSLDVDKDTVNNFSKTEEEKFLASQMITADVQKTDKRAKREEKSVAEINKQVCDEAKITCQDRYDKMMALVTDDTYDVVIEKFKSIYYDVMIDKLKNEEKRIVFDELNVQSPILDEIWHKDHDHDTEFQLSVDIANNRIFRYEIDQNVTEVTFSQDIDGNTTVRNKLPVPKHWNTSNRTQSPRLKSATTKTHRNSHQQDTHHHPLPVHVPTGSADSEFSQSKHNFSHPPSSPTEQFRNKPITRNSSHSKPGADNVTPLTHDLVKPITVGNKSPTFEDKSVKSHSSCMSGTSIRKRNTTPATFRDSSYTGLSYLPSNDKTMKEDNCNYSLARSQSSLPYLGFYPKPLTTKPIVRSKSALAGMSVCYEPNIEGVCVQGKRVRLRKQGK